ncbi:MAG: glycerate kinase [Leifsonia sp.]
MLELGLGATATDVAVLEAGVERFAAAAQRAGAVVDPTAPAAGAAGGTGFGLMVWGATVTAGAAAVGEAIGLLALVETADAVLTGEGRFDNQSAAGKVPEYVSILAEAAGVPAFLAAGSIAAEVDAFVATASLSVLAGGVAEAISEP